MKVREDESGKKDSVKRERNKYKDRMGQRRGKYIKKGITWEERKI